MTATFSRAGKFIAACFLMSLATTTFAGEANEFKVENLKWSGDLRLRLSQAHEATDQDRFYQQLRARLGVRADVQPDLSAIVRLATGTSAISTNQTLGDSSDPGMTRRNFGVDLAYGEWRFLESGRLFVGRSVNPFFSPGGTQLVFDSDLNFEGVSASWKPRWSESTAFATLAGFIISENYSAPSDIVDTGLLALELGYSLKSSVGQWTMRAARFHYVNVQDRAITSFDKNASSDRYSLPSVSYKGNTVYAFDATTARRFRYDFVQTQAGVEWKYKAADALDLTVYGDWITNERAGNGDDAFETGIGAKFGRAQFVFAYSVKKRDSVVGAFTDSDFSGGGADNRGSKIGLVYRLSEASTVAYTEYIATRGVDTTSRDYSLRQLDFALQF